MDDNTTLSGSVGGPFPGPNGGFAPHDSFASSNDDSSSYESSTGSLVEEDANENHAAIAPSETKAVKISKRMVLLAIFVAAIGVATAAYVVTAEDEKESFHQEFDSLADEIESTMANQLMGSFAQLRSLSTTITSHALEWNSTWPLVTVPHFDKRASEVRASSAVEAVVWAPLVTQANEEEWEQYVTGENQDWIAQDMVSGEFNSITREVDATGWHALNPGNVIDEIYAFDGTDGSTGSLDGAHLPIWQYGPAPINASLINLDLNSHGLGAIFSTSYDNDIRVVSRTAGFLRLLEKVYRENAVADDPHAFVLQPVYEDFTEGAPIVGFLVGVLAWRNLLDDLLVEKMEKFVVEINDNCGSNFAFKLQSDFAILGDRDMRDSGFDYLSRSTPLTQILDPSNKESSYALLCDYIFTTHPSPDLEGDYVDNKPIIYTAVVLLIFFFTAGVFVVYDRMVQKRQDKVMNTAIRTNAVVASLFPKSVGQRLIADVQKTLAKKENGEDESTKDGGNQGPVGKTKPIADLFPDATIMFADLVGFTAWSSTREPTQVFMLLETIYHAFDEIARRRRVFKIETIGDCYVAVVGLPERRRDHQVVMCRFATDCLEKFDILTKQLEVELGPDTADLGMRTGLHSGPVTAGVLRGERARFQLFGDTVNTTARMESTGAKGKIHLSQETADLLVQAGKGHWITARENKVVAKGKGELQTYWLDIRVDAKPENSSEFNADSHLQRSLNGLDPESSSVAKGDEPCTLTAKQGRLVDWNSDILLKLLNEIVARRRIRGGKMDLPGRLKMLEGEAAKSKKMVLDEVKEIITLPQYDGTAVSNVDAVELPEVVVKQLREYVQTVASMYRDNPFHNFEHASHVTMSCVKLLSRIVAPDLKPRGNDDVAKRLHDHTYGITSDPLTQFAVILAGLLHDVDHTGVPNAQLVKEQAEIATQYRNKSVAEQNSVDIAWNLLMQDSYSDLRRTIYGNENEFRRFRQLLVNSVMATDIMDKDLKALRNGRWDKAFSEGARRDSAVADVNRKATIVIEHLIQASDVAHTMQHWHIYRKWNERLFEEMYKAYVEGRSDTDPSTNWYSGEIGFFDHYIIPLANKLRSCGVFGVSSDEYLTYARQNRKEWEQRGRVVVEEFMENVRKQEWFVDKSAPAVALEKSK